MIKKIIFMIVALIVITGCDSNNLLEKIGLKEKITNVIQERNGIAYLPNEEEPFTGKYEVFYLEGHKKRVITYKNGKREGITTTWFENGQKQFEENYKDGKIEGIATFWFEDGSKSELNSKDRGK